MFFECVLVAIDPAVVEVSVTRPFLTVASGRNTGTDPGTLAENESRCKEGMS